jgi:hypothetical protein
VLEKAIDACRVILTEIQLGNIRPKKSCMQPTFRQRAETALLVTILLAQAGLACDVIVCKGAATADGSLLMTAHWNWTDACPYPMMHVNREYHQPGEIVQLSFRTIAQVEVTWAYNYAHPTYGAAGMPPEIRLVANGINEWGVAIGNTTIRGNVPCIANGVDEDDVNRLVLDRATTAQEAVQLMGQLLTDYGFAAQSKYGDNGHLWLVVDPNDAWVVESGGGRQWVARQITEDMWHGSNGPTITNQWDIGSDVVQYALDRGWITEPNDFMWAGVFTYGCCGYEARIAKVMPWLQARYGAITPEVFKELAEASGPLRPIGLQAGMVAYLRANVPEMIKYKAWFCQRQPLYNKVFFPLYTIDGVGISSRLAPPECEYWDVAVNSLTAEQKETFEGWADGRAERVEERVRQYLELGQISAAEDLIRAFHDEVIDQAICMYQGQSLCIQEPDFNADGIVDMEDFSILANHWQECTKPECGL